MQPRRRVLRNPDTCQRLGPHLRATREAYGYTQAEVATQLNLSRAQYTNLEVGRCMLTFDQLVSIAKLYRLTVSQLLQGLS